MFNFLIPALASLPATVLLVPMEGVLEWVRTLSTDVLFTMRVIAGVLAVVFIVWQGVASRGSLARIIIAGLAAGVFFWLVYNVTSVKDAVGEDMFGMISAVPSWVAGHWPVTSPPSPWV